MNDNDELKELGRRQGALWARDVIKDVVKNDDELSPTMKAQQLTWFPTAMAGLAACGVDQVGRAVFTKAADDEMARRFGLVLEAMRV